MSKQSPSPLPGAAPGALQPGAPGVLQQPGAPGAQQRPGAPRGWEADAFYRPPEQATVQLSPPPPYLSCEHPPRRIVQPNVVLTQKSRFLAAVLAFLLGSFGVHNFYLGYNGAGFVQIAMTVLGWATAWLLVGFFLLVPAAIWAFAEMIVLLVAKTGRYAHSANGVPLS